MSKEMREHIDNFKNFLKEDVVNKSSKTSTRLVEVEYNGEKMKAVAIGYGSGPYFKEVYYLLDDIQYENNYFDNVKEIDGSDLIVGG
jgi:CRISPR/Cas system CSM-associated protein Csm5 (group 7 of RAMP superfamily)